MSAAVLYMSMSLDGFIEDADGGFSWAEPDAEVHAFVNDLERPIGTHLYGRRMYETMAVWQTIGDELGLPEQDYAEQWRAHDKVVYSSTLEDPSWNNTTVIRGDLRDQIEALKARTDGDILVAGSAQLVQGLVAAGLVHELHLMVYPVVLGAGKRLFADSPELPFTLLESRPSSQVTLLTLRRA